MNFKKALQWSFFSEIASRAIQPAVFIILARILTPIDFGVMTASIMVIAFTQIFWDAGMGKALIQEKNNIVESANAAFWINLSFSIIISAFLFYFSKKIATNFFQDIRVSNVIRVMTLQIILGALGSVQTALFQKEMLFHKLFWVRFLSVSIPAVASIPLAKFGWGYWALVVGAVLGQFIQTIMLWVMSNWKPGFHFDRRVAIILLKFGSWVALTGLLTWSWTWLDNMIVGYYFGTKDVGLFRMGNQIPQLIFALLFSFASPVLYSRFATSINVNNVKNELNRILSLLPLFSLPIAILIITNSSFVEKYILGSKWVGTSYIISAIATKEAVSWIFAYNIEAYRSIKKPHIETFIAGVSLLINLVVLIYFSKFGFDKFVFAKAYIVGFLGFILHFSVLIYTFGWSKIYNSILFKILLYLIIIIIIPYFKINNLFIKSFFSFFIALSFFIYLLSITPECKKLISKFTSKNNE
jgi:PST family polysaccharide transporter